MYLATTMHIACTHKGLPYYVTKKLLSMMFIPKHSLTDHSRTDNRSGSTWFSFPARTGLLD